jgi:hypothetical protein
MKTGKDDGNCKDTTARMMGMMARTTTRMEAKVTAVAAVFLLAVAKVT